MKIYFKFTTSVLMTALAISSGYLLSFLPNVELVIPIIFLSGYIVGISSGVITGILTFLIYGYFNPYGSSPFFLLISQCLGGAIAGVLGGIYCLINKKNIYICSIFGFLSLLLYDALTTISGFFLFPTEKTFFAYVFVGIPFNLIHIFSGTLIYAILIYPLTKRLKR